MAPSAREGGAPILATCRGLARSCGGVDGAEWRQSSCARSSRRGRSPSSRRPTRGRLPRVVRRPLSCRRMARSAGPQMPGGVAQYEQRRAPGAAALFVLPDVAAGIAITAYLDRAESTPHWATYWGPEAGRAGANPRDLYSIGSDGIRTVASIGYPLDSVFVPGLRVLPSDVQGGCGVDERRHERVGAARPPTARRSRRSSPTRRRSSRGSRRADELAGFAHEGCLETASRPDPHARPKALRSPITRRRSGAPAKARSPRRRLRGRGADDDATRGRGARGAGAAVGARAVVAASRIVGRRCRGGAMERPGLG